MLTNLASPITSRLEVVLNKLEIFAILIQSKIFFE